MGSAATSPTRVSNDLYEAAKSVGETMSRSAAQQINHWARVGRAVEAATNVSSHEILRVLAGESSYDDLAPAAQAVVRAEWDERIAATRSRLDLAAEFEAAGITDWVGSDAER